MKSLREKAKNSLTVSWVEGIPAAVMLGIVDNYIIPYALFLNASNREIGFLVALPHLAGSLMQLYAVDIVRYFKSRKQFLIYGSLSQALMLIPLAALAYCRNSFKIRCLIALLAVYRVIGNLIGTAWGSLVSDYFPAEKRGDYFGWRAQITGIAGLLGIAGGGFFLSSMKQINPTVGFLLLFLTAVFARFLSMGIMTGHADLPMRQDLKSDFTFLYVSEKIPRK